MTQINDQQVETANRVAAKLQAFYDSLPEDEQAMCILGIRRLGDEDATDTRAFMINHRAEGPEELPDEPNRLIPYRINGPILYTQITPSGTFDR
jgi:hypothetical protein